MRPRPFISWLLFGALAFVALGCARTEIITSPRTLFLSDAAETPEPQVIFSSRNLNLEFDYLGQVKTRAFTYDGALERLKEGARELKADAVIDVHFERVGFLKTMQAFAVKFKK